MHVKKFLCLKNIAYLAVTLLLSIFIVSGGHVASSETTSHSNASNQSSAECQSSCPIVPERRKSETDAERNQDPDPFPELPYYVGKNTYLYLGVTLYAVLLLEYLRRRPPDLVVLFGNFQS